MKRLIGVLAVIAAAFAAPVIEGEYPEGYLSNADVTSGNYSSLARHTIGVGWSDTDGGTNGGAAGSQFTVWDAFALRDAINYDLRRIVIVRGRIDLTPLFVSSPGVRLRVGAYTTIRGGDSNAEIFGGGLSISNVRQVIIENLKMYNALSYAPGETPNGIGGIVNLGNQDYSSIDFIEISGSHHVLVDHCEFSDHPWDANRSPRRHDGIIDIVRGADLVTVSNSIFENHVFTSLVGNGEAMGDVDSGKLRVTFFANWFRGTGQRNPYVRFGRVHVLNNLYTNLGDYGVGAGYASEVFMERNVFVDCRHGRGAIISDTNPRGKIYDLRNIVRNCSFENNIHSNLSWDPWHAYPYQAIPIGNVEDHVRRYAGIWK